jgi:small subunit ribosomal protein S18
MNFWNKEKKNFATGTNFQKKRSNWNQSLRSIKSPSSNKSKKIKKKKSLQYLLILKIFKNIIDYKNIKLLKAFLTKFGKIRPRRKTRIPVQKQHAISKAIRKARDLKLIPFTINVKI